MWIIRDSVTHPAVIALLEEHVATNRLHSPPESVHALDLDGLRDPSMTLWSAWDDDALMGTGGLKNLGGGHGEVKAMKTAGAHLRRGVGAALLDVIVTEARARGYGRLSLETGSMAAFEPARAMYGRAGFIDCAPFGGYVKDPYSVFMTLALCPLPLSRERVG